MTAEARRPAARIETLWNRQVQRQARGRLHVATRGQGFTDLTGAASGWLAEIAAGDGALTLFLAHTSAGLTIQENTDPDVTADLADALDRLVPEGAAWRHGLEGPDDMPAHVKSSLAGVTLTVPVTGGRLDLGTWQAIYLAEFRKAPHGRDVTLHYVGS